MIISLDKALQVMDSGEPFSIEFVTFDANRGTGGERISYKAAVLCKSGKGNHKNFHYRNNTRNIKSAGTEEVRAVHPLLITQINGCQVGL